MSLTSIINNFRSFDLFWFSIRRSWVKTVISLSYGKRIQIYRDMTSHIRSTDIDDALTTLQKESEKLRAIELLMYEEIQIALRDQKSFFVAIAEWIPRNEALQIYVSKQGREVNKHSLPDSIDAARSICEKKGDLFKMYASKLTYPVIMSFVALALFFAFRLYGFDFLTGLRPFEEWPYDAQSSFNTLAFFGDNIFIILIGLVVFGFLLSLFMTRGTGRIRAFFNFMPPFSIYQGVTSYTVLMSLASLTRSGVQLTESLRLISGSLTGWARVELKEIIEKLERPEHLPDGYSLTEYAFNSSLFTKLIRVKVGSYARRSDFVENLEYLNTVLLHDVSAQSLKSAAVLSGLVIVCVLLFIVEIALIFFAALFGDA